MDFTDYDTRLAAYAFITDEDGQILLSWFNGAGGPDQGWTLPGGGVEFEESVEEAIVREVHEETGHHVILHEPMAVHSFTMPRDAPTSRPYKSVRVVYRASITGGTLGTVEVGGTTDFAAWVPLARLHQEHRRSNIVDVAVDAWRTRNVS